MVLDTGWRGTPAQKLTKFATALKVWSQRSAAVEQLLEATNSALEAGETELDGVRLDGLRLGNDDVEVTGGEF